MSSQINPNGMTHAETEVRQKPARASFSAEYKRQIVKEYTSAEKRGEKAAILRREGLYSSTVTNWCNEFASAAEPKKRGRKPSPDTPLKKELERLQRENERLKQKLEHAELIIDVQKKVSRMLETLPPSSEKS